MTAPVIEPLDYRTAMGHFCTGVTVITAADEEGPVGFACQSFAALSLDPPGGGSDLVFPHHEYSAVHAEALTGTKPFAGAYVHAAMRAAYRPGRSDISVLGHLAARIQ